MDSFLWGKSEGDGKQLTPLQSMASGFSAACLGPVATGPFDVVKVCLPACFAASLRLTTFQSSVPASVSTAFEHVQSIIIRRSV